MWLHVRYRVKKHHIWLCSCGGLKCEVVFQFILSNRRVTIQYLPGISSHDRSVRVRHHRARRTELWKSPQQLDEYVILGIASILSSLLSILPISRLSIFTYGSLSLHCEGSRVGKLRFLAKAIGIITIISNIHQLDKRLKNCSYPNNGDNPSLTYG